MKLFGIILTTDYDLRRRDTEKRREWLAFTYLRAGVATPPPPGVIETQVCSDIIEARGSIPQAVRDRFERGASWDGIDDPYLARLRKEKTPMSINQPVRDNAIRETFDGQTHEIAWVSPARKEAVKTVMDAEVGTGDGRTEFFWIRLANGDLFLGVAPQGETYEGLEGEPGAGWGT